MRNAERTGLTVAVITLVLFERVRRLGAARASDTCSGNRTPLTLSLPCCLLDFGVPEV